MRNTTQILPTTSNPDCLELVSCDDTPSSSTGTTTSYRAVYLKQLKCKINEKHNSSFTKKQVKYKSGALPYTPQTLSSRIVIEHAGDHLYENLESCVFDRDNPSDYQYQDLENRVFDRDNPKNDQDQVSDTYESSIVLLWFLLYCTDTLQGMLMTTLMALSTVERYKPTLLQ